MNQQTLRKKIASTHNIKHIAEAVELVASVKLQKLLKTIEQFRFYAARVKELVGNVAQVAKENSHPLLTVREVKKIGVIIVTSDKGLCGSYNANILQQADHFLEEHAHKDLQLVLFGQKSVDHYSKKTYAIQSQHVQYISNINESHVKEWCAECIKSFEHAVLDEVWIIYTHYKNILSRETKVEKILPMQHQEDTPTGEPLSDYIFEPKPEEIYEKIIPYSLYTKILSLFLESQASELSARVVSMKAAATNAEEVIAKFTLVKNKMRQFGITKEILEINAGAESIS